MIAAYRSDLEDSGDFNLMLVVTSPNTAALGPNKASYEAFMAKFTKEQADRTSEYAQKNYPGMRGFFFAPERTQLNRDRVACNAGSYSARA